MLAHEVVGVLLAFIALAAFTSALSPKAQTGSVLKAGADGFNQVLTTAVSPVNG